MSRAQALPGRFDHAVILVPDLAAATATFTELGFTVSPGGAHTGLGTHNALIRFGVDYIELLAVRDEAEALRARSSTSSVVDLLRAGRVGLATFALATADIDRDAARLRERGVEAVGPFPMERMRPDGRRLSWRLLVPRGDSFGRAWPFLIQWDQEDATRLSWERQAAHANGATGVRAIAVATRDIDATAALYETLGLESGRAFVDGGGRSARVFTLGTFEVRLHGSDREGPFELTLASSAREGTEMALGSRLVFVKG